jgi:hypothetical protein
MDLKKITAEEKRLADNALHNVFLKNGARI